MHAKVVGSKLRVYDQKSIVVIKGWPYMLAWQRYKDRPWRSIRPRIDLRLGVVSTSRTRHRSHAWWNARQHILLGTMENTVKAFFQSTPKEERDIASSFESRQWHVLALLCRCPPVKDIFHTNRGLGYSLASAWCYGATPSRLAMNFVRKIVGLRRRMIVERLGFPAEEKWVRLLGLLTADACSVRNIFYLRDLSVKGASHTLNHLPRITQMTMACLSDPRIRNLVWCNVNTLHIFLRNWKD